MATVQLVLLADILPHPGLIQAYRAHAVTRRPEVQARHPALMKQLPMDPNGALTLQESHRVSHAGLGRDAQAQVDVVGHRMPFHQFDASLSAQLPQDWTDPTPQPSGEDFPAVLRYDHHVVLALPPHMGQALL